MNRLRKLFTLIFQTHLFVRNLHSSAGLFESFFVSAVISVLGIRFYLQLTGFPQIGTGGLHIAHMLWGGLLMLAALIIMLSFISQASIQVAAIIGGLGFGAFIDELGKFVTRDHNYFFEPTIALIYASFVLLYLLFEALGRSRQPTQREYLVNALDLAKEAVLQDLEPHEKQRVLALLAESDQSDPLVVALRDLLSKSAEKPQEPHPLVRVRLLLSSCYRGLVSRWWFNRSVVIFFVIEAVLTLSQAATFIQWSREVGLWLLAGVALMVGLARFSRPRWRSAQVGVMAGTIGLAVLVTWTALIDARPETLSFAAWARLVSSTVAGGFVVLGILRIGASRLGAFQMFERAVLISILLTQVFSFYQHQLVALTGLVINVFILVTLRFLIAQERDRVSELKSVSVAERRDRGMGRPSLPTRQ